MAAFRYGLHRNLCLHASKCRALPEALRACRTIYGSCRRFFVLKTGFGDGCFAWQWTDLGNVDHIQLVMYNKTNGSRVPTGTVPLVQGKTYGAE